MQTRDTFSFLKHKFLKHVLFLFYDEIYLPLNYKGDGKTTALLLHDNKITCSKMQKIMAASIYGFYIPGFKCACTLYFF